MKDHHALLYYYAGLHDYIIRNVDNLMKSKRIVASVSYNWAVPHVKIISLWKQKKTYKLVYIEQHLVILSPWTQGIYSILNTNPCLVRLAIFSLILRFINSITINTVTKYESFTFMWVHWNQDMCHISVNIAGCSAMTEVWGLWMLKLKFEIALHSYGALHWHTGLENTGNVVQICNA